MDWAKDDPRRTYVLHVHAAMSAVGRRREPAASYESAAVMHNIDLFKHPEKTVTLTVPRGPIGTRAGGVVVHNAELPPAQLAKKYEVRVTNPARTVADLARTLPFMEAVVAADSALRQKLAGKEEVRAVLNGCASWPGTGQAQRVIEFANPGGESVLESCARVILAERIPEATPELQYGITGPGFTYRVDLYYAAYRTIVELDGMMKYETRNDIRKQFDRDRALRDAGYKIVHVTWHELFDTPETVAGRIRKAFAAPSPW
jgi:hypothetical protein